MPTRSRGRPRSFDTDRALDRALDVFWTRGLAASSLDDLCTAMDIARPSLYAAFGDKEELYVATAELYSRRIAELFVTAFAGGGSMRDGVLAFWRAAIATYTRHARGCMVVCTAATEAAAHPKVRTVLARVLAEVDAAYVRIASAALDRGELPAGASVPATAALLSATQFTLAIRARAGASADELEGAATLAAGALFERRRSARDPLVVRTRRATRPSAARRRTS